MGAAVTPRKAAATLMQKPRSHDTSRIACAKLMARVGEEFPLECPACGGDIRLIAFKLLFECETIPGLRTFGNLRLLQTSCPRARADPEDFDAPRRTARTSASVTCPWPAHRLGRPRADPRRPGHLSIVARRAARNRHPPPLTAAASQVTTTPPGHRTQRHSAPTPEQRHSRGEAGGPGKAWRGSGEVSTQLTSRSSVRQCSRKCHWPGYSYDAGDESDATAGRPPLLRRWVGKHRREPYSRFLQLHGKRSADAALLPVFHPLPRPAPPLPFASLPQHLKPAHAHLSRTLSADSPYHGLDQPGWWWVAKRTVFGGGEEPVPADA
jgi:hypothetical protein